MKGNKCKGPKLEKEQKVSTSLCDMKPYKSELERRKESTVMLCKGRFWQQNEQDEEEHGTGEEKGSQRIAANSFCDFRWWRWKLHMAQHQKVTPICQFP